MRGNGTCAVILGDSDGGGRVGLTGWEGVGQGGVGVGWEVVW